MKKSNPYTLCFWLPFLYIFILIPIILFIGNILLAILHVEIGLTQIILLCLTLLSTILLLNPLRKLGAKQFNKANLKEINYSLIFIAAFYCGVITHNLSSGNSVEFVENTLMFLCYIIEISYLKSALKLKA